jgi:hypothetical protein
MNNDDDSAVTVQNVTQANQLNNELSQPGFLECQSVEKYEFLNQIDQGTYGVVCK